MIVRKFIFISAMILIAGQSLFGQQYFNQLYRMGWKATYPKAVLSTENGIYFSASCLDTTPPGSGVFYGKLSHKGDLVTLNKLFDVDRRPFPEDVSMLKYNDSAVVMVVSYIDPNAYSFYLLNKSGDISKEYILPLDYLPEDLQFFGLGEIIKADDCFYMVFNYKVEEQQYARKSLLALNDTFGLIWEMEIDPRLNEPVSKGDHEFINELELIDDTLYLFGARSYKTLRYAGHKSDLRFLKISREGEIMEDVIHVDSTIYDAPYKAEITSNGKLILGSSSNWEYNYWIGIYLHGEVHSRSAVHVFDRNFNREKQTHIGALQTGRFYSSWIHDIKLSNAEDGCIVAGVAFYDDEDPQYYIKHAGMVGKVSNAGDSLWCRFFKLEEKDANRVWTRRLVPTYDRKGYIVAGNVSKYNEQDSAIVVNAWFMFVDEYGCSVPGCHLLAADDPEAEEFNGLLLYPNPASGTAYIYLEKPKAYQEAEVIVTDNLGRRLYETGVITPNITIHLDISAWQSGIYHVSVLAKDKILGTRKLVIQ